MLLFGDSRFDFTDFRGGAVGLLMPAHISDHVFVNLGPMRKQSMKASRDLSLNPLPQFASQGLGLEHDDDKKPAALPQRDRLDTSTSTASGVAGSEAMGSGVVQDTRDIGLSSKQRSHATSSSSFEAAARIGKSHFEAGDYQKALQYYERALRQKHHSIQSESTEIKGFFVEALYNIGCIHSMKAHWDPAKSIQAFELCLDLQRARFGPKNFPVAVILYKLASAWGAMNEHQTAADILSEALAIALSTKPESQELADIWMALGQQIKSLDHREDSSACFEEARRIYEQLEKR